MIRFATSADDNNDSRIDEVSSERSDAKIYSTARRGRIVLSLSVTAFLICHVLKHLLWRLDSSRFFDRFEDATAMQVAFLLPQVVFLMAPSVIVTTVVFAFPRLWIALLAIVCCAAMMLHPAVWIRAGELPSLALTAKSIFTVLVPFAAALVTRRWWLRYAADAEPIPVQFGLGELIVFVAAVAAIFACFQLSNLSKPSGIGVALVGYLSSSLVACATVGLSLSNHGVWPIFWAFAAWVVYVVVELAQIGWPDWYLALAWVVTALLGFCGSFGIRLIFNRRMKLNA